MTSINQPESDKNTLEEPVNGCFKVRVSEDQLSVYLVDVRLPVGEGKEVSLCDVKEELKSQKITAEIDEENINRILKTSADDTSDLSLCIARGVEAVNGEDDEFSWHIPEYYLRQNCAVVLPDDLIASYKEATRGSAGKNVFGKSIACTHGERRRLHIGAGLKTIKLDGGEEYRAMNMGRVLVEKDHSEFIQVESLVKLNEDSMQASMDIYALNAKGEEISFDNILCELSANGISYGIDEAMIRLSLKKASNMSSNKPLACVEDVVVAQGAEAQPPKDASLIISREENIIGAELSGGYIDFHELGYPWNVSQGDRIGYLLEARQGVEGITVLGAKIKTRKPVNIKCKFEGLHKDDKGRLIADIDGALIINGNRLSVVDLLVVNSDVGPKTGNIHSKIPVHVKGHVKAGYILESENDIIVEKNVENATVRSGDSILIKGGIRGRKSEIYSPSDVRVAFVENAAIYVNGNLCVTGSIINSTVATNGTVMVTDHKNKPGLIVGGELTVNKHLEVSELGSNVHSKTIIRMGVAQEERRQITLIDKELDEIKLKLERVKQIQYHHKMTPKNDTRDVLYKMEIASIALLQNQSKLEEKKKTVLEQLKQVSDDRLVVKAHVYPGVIVFIKDRYMKINSKLGPGYFMFDVKADMVTYVDQA